MKIINNKNISLFSIFFSIFLILGLAYSTSESYRNYEKVEKERHYMGLIVKLDKLYHMIEEEKHYHPIYLGDKKKFNEKRLKEYRDSINSEIKTILSFIKNDVECLQYKQMLEGVLIELNAYWSGDNLILKDHYVKSLTSFTDSIEKLLSKNSESKEQEKLYYIELLNLEKNLNSEESFISFILNNSTIMTDAELLYWEAFINKDTVVDFSTLKDEVLRSKVNRIIDFDYFPFIGEVERGQVFSSFMTGKYPISVAEWSSVLMDKMQKISSVEELFLSDIKVDVNTRYAMIKDELIKFAIAFIFSFILFLVLLYVYSNIDKNSRFLSNTLKDIEEDLNEKQKKEIKEVIKKNDTIEIYKFLANAIKEPSRAKDHFLANMSHEIRTPLNGIIGFTNILKDTQLNDDQKEFLHIIEESSNNLIHIVNDILDFSKVTSGKVEFENILFDVMEKFESSIETYGAKAAQKNIDLSLYIDPTLSLKLMGDPTKISQVLINLLSNAIKFTDKDGEIKVSIEKHSENSENILVRFSVQDSGIGISREEQKIVFDAFSQADASTSRKFGGTGLGLTISSNFVKLMGGELKIDSKEGEGSTFYFTLPLKKSEESKEKSIIIQKEDLQVAYITSVHERKRGTTKNLKTYVEYSGAKLKIYSYESFMTKKRAFLPDIIFLDRTVIKSEDDMRRLLELNIKVVLITTTEMINCHNSLRDKLEKIIYKPLNYTKIIKSLELVHNRPIASPVTVQKVQSVNANRLFTGLKILVAEDNNINQKLILNILNNLDIEVTLTANGEEVLSQYKKEKYDMILMDVQMPVMTGVEATKEIIKYEKENAFEHTPIVALTANVIESDKEKYLKSGMDEYLKKPIDVKELVRIIESFYPVEGVRDSLELEREKAIYNVEKDYIILYKELELTGKIYSAILTNLGYEVDRYSDKNEFLEQLDNKNYVFAMFDAKPFEDIHSDKLVVDLINDSGATPIAFVEKNNKSNYCLTLNTVENYKEIEYRLKCS